MKTSLKFSTFVLLVILACAHAQTDINDELTGNWQELPLPESKYSGIHSIGIEPGGTLWTMANNKVYYWDGKQFREPANVELRSGYYLANLIGGGDRPLYATQITREEHKSKLYELTDGKAVYVTDLYFDSSGNRSCVYVSKSGRLFNWGKRFLAIFKDGKWERIEARLTAKPLILDNGTTTYFYFDKNIYWLDEKNQFETCKLSLPEEAFSDSHGVSGTLWDKNKIVLFERRGKGVYVCSLNDGKLLDSESLNSSLGEKKIYGAIATDSHGLWFFARDPAKPSYSIYQVNPYGVASELPETLGIGWDPGRLGRQPHSILETSDGSMWFATSRKGIAIYREGHLSRYAWEHGVSFGKCTHLREGDNGVIYAASYERIFAFFPKQPILIPSWVDRWQEYKLASPHLISDKDGNIWMFLKDKPGMVSCWDGTRWNSTKVPFDTSKVSRMMVDDQGHILLSMVSYPDGCYDVSPRDVRHYKDIKPMLLAAVNRGVKLIMADKSFQDCVVLDGPKIWFGYRNSNRTYYFDGDRWDEFEMRDHIHYLCESSKYGVLLRTQGEKFYRYDRGQFVQVDAFDRRSRRWLLGPRSLQPYEEELLELRPKQYLPVMRSEKNKVFMLIPKAGSSLEDRGEGFVEGPELHRDMRGIKPGYMGGFWSEPSSNRIFRILGAKVVQSDWRDTPLPDNADNIRQVLEDRAGNLWVDGGYYVDGRHVFVQRMQDFVLRTEDVSAEAIRSLTISAQAFWGDEVEPKARLFWRFEGGYWRGGELGDSVTIDFPEDGTYRIELIAMGPQGGITPKPLSFTVKAATGFPDTIATEGGPYTAQDVLWKIPARAATSKLAAGAKLVYRINEGQRKPAYKGNMVEFGSLEPGQYSVEVTACEDGRYYDPAPLVFEVTYAPNYERIVESRIDDILSDDNERAEQAMSEVKKAGIAVIAVLEEWIGELQHEDQHRQRLERLLREIQNQGQMLHERERYEWWRGSRGR